MLEIQRIRFAGWELTEGSKVNYLRGPSPDLHRAISIFELFRFSKFSLQVLQPLQDIQKGIFEIQLAGFKLLRGPFPDLHMHRAISIFEMQFAGATTTTTSTYPK